MVIKIGKFSFEATARVRDFLGNTFLAEITAAIADMKVSILQINTQNTQKGIAMNLTVGCKNVNHYNAIVSRIRGIRSVLSVERGIKGGN